MFITGNPFSDVLNYLMLILPLLSVGIILFRKGYTDDAHTVVMVLCLFLFLQKLVVPNSKILGLSAPIMHNLFNLVEFMLMVMILKLYSTSTRFRYVLNGFLIAYCSSIITYYAILGFWNDQLGLRSIQYGIMILMMVVTIGRQWSKQALEMLNTPLFWISVSTLFYFSFCLFWEAGKTYIFDEQENSSVTSAIFMQLATVIRFLIFTVAIWFLEPSHKALSSHHHENHEGVHMNNSYGMTA